MCRLRPNNVVSSAGKRFNENFQDPNGHLCDLHDDPGGPLPLGCGLPQQPACRRRGAVHAHPSVHPGSGGKGRSIIALKLSSCGGMFVKTPRKSKTNHKTMYCILSGVGSPMHVISHWKVNKLKLNSSDVITKLAV